MDLVSCGGWILELPSSSCFLFVVVIKKFASQYQSCNWTCRAINLCVWTDNDRSNLADLADHHMYWFKINGYHQHHRKPSRTGTIFCRHRWHQSFVYALGETHLRVIVTTYTFFGLASMLFLWMPAFWSVWNENENKSLKVMMYLLFSYHVWAGRLHYDVSAW